MGERGFGQTQIKKEDTTKTFIYYAFDGLGSNMGSMQPKVEIAGTKLIYAYSQNSYYGKRTKQDTVICTATFRQSSIDSILSFIENLKDSFVHKINPCIMSGGIHFLIIGNGLDTTRFRLDNTFDYTALKIVDVINKYLPDKNKLWPDKSLIKNEKDCWKMLLEDKKAHKDNLKRKPKGKERRITKVFMKLGMT